LVRLAEALIARADAKQRIAQLSERITRNAKYQEGDDPAEDPNTLLTEYEAVAARYQELIARINRTNLGVQLPDGRSITDAIAE